jgi:diaminopimelate decarboxylase
MRPATSVTILLCAAGRRPYLVRWFQDALRRNAADGRVIVADADPHAPAGSLADAFIRSPSFTDPGYGDWLRESLEGLQVDLALSVNDFELSTWSALEPAPEALITLGRVQQQVMEDKLALARAMEELGVRCPGTWLASEVFADEGFLRDDADEFVVKSRFGSGSVGLRFASRDALPAAIERASAHVLDRRGRPVPAGSLAAEHVIVQARVHGEEFGVDVVADLAGRYASTLARRKLSMRHGETDQAVSVDPAPFAAAAAALTRATRHRGPIDTDFIVDERGDAWLLDVNPRFGGGYPFSHMAGADVPAALVAWLLGRQPEPRWLQADPGVVAAKAVDIARVPAPDADRTSASTAAPRVLEQEARRTDSDPHAPPDSRSSAIRPEHSESEATVHVSPESPATPSFVVDEPTLRRFCDRFRAALTTHWPNAILAYSFKTNSLPWLIGFMRDRGAWAEVVSDTEYELALALGYSPDRIVFNGPVKSRDRLRAALLDGSVVNLDSHREVRWACELARERPDRQLSVGLRVNWDLEARRPGESATAEEGGRFGFTVDNGDFDAVLAALRSAGVRAAGIHLHVSSLSRSVEVFRAAAAVASELIVSRGLLLDYVDLGGGFFGSEEEGAPTFDRYIEVIREGLGGAVDPERTRLIVEPGQCLIAVPVEFHTSVVDVKTVGAHTVVVTDGSRSNLDPTYRRKRPYDYTLATSAERTAEHQIISGFTCLEHDRIMRLQHAPALAEGDRVIYSKVGAYSMCFQPLFIQYLPAVHVRDERGNLTMVRRPWGVDEYLQGHSLYEVPAEVAAPAAPHGAAAREVAASASLRTEWDPAW